MLLKIDTDIPPPDTHPRNNGFSGTLRALEVGNSFELEAGAANNIAPIISRISKSTGRSFTYRSTGAGQYRVWRIS